MKTVLAFVEGFLIGGVAIVATGLLAWYAIGLFLNGHRPLLMADVPILLTPVAIALRIGIGALVTWWRSHR